MAELQQSFDQRLMEILIPWVNNPIVDYAITAVASELDAAEKKQLRAELNECWKTETKAMDHRSICRNTVKVSFGRLSHHIAARAMGEFARQRRLYSDCYTIGLKYAIDTFAQNQALSAAVTLSDDCQISGWRLDPTKVHDFRRRNGERLIMVSPVTASFEGQKIRGKTANISNGGALVCFKPEYAPKAEIGNPITLHYDDLCRKYQLDSAPVKYQVVNVDKKAELTRFALKRVDIDDKSEFDLLIAHLMNEHKRRNKLDVDNTVSALTARCLNLAAVAQMSALMVLSHHLDRYHLLVTQGQSLHLQAQLQIDGDMIPYMVENTKAGETRMFLAWADNRSAVFLADIAKLHDNGHYESALSTWKKATWNKVFLLKAANVNPQLADLGTSLPCDVAPAVSKLNAPLPVKVARLSQELAKMAIIEDITFILDPIVADRTGNGVDVSAFQQYRVQSCKGQLRQVPFDKKALPDFEETYRFSHECCLRVGKREFVIVNGYSDTEEAVISLPLNKHDLSIGDTATIVWNVDGSDITLDATIFDHDVIHQSTTIKWQGEPESVQAVFRKLQILCVFSTAFTADLSANKLDSALRNLILSNLPKVSIFAKVREQAISLTGLTGDQYLNELFVDEGNRAKIDLLFSPQILQKLAMGGARQHDALLLGLSEDSEGELKTERRLLSELGDFKQIRELYQQLGQQGQTFVFALDVSQPAHHAEDAIVNIEYKYVTHYSPAKARKLDDTLAFNLSIQMIDISELFGALL